MVVAISPAPLIISWATVVLDAVDLLIFSGQESRCVDNAPGLPQILEQYMQLTEPLF